MNCRRAVTLHRLTYLLMLLSFVALPALAADLDGWRIVQVSPADQLAVAKSPEGGLQLVREGDRLGAHLTVTGFDDERIILEGPGEWGPATLFVRVVEGRETVARRERQPLRKSDVAGAPATIVAHPEAPNDGNR